MHRKYDYQPKRSTREPHEKVVQARYSFSEPKIIETIICENYTGSTDSSISSDVIENTPPNMLNNVTSRKRCEKDSHITNSDNQEDMRIQNNLLVPDAGQESENFGILTEKPNNDCSNKYDRITSPPTLINIIKQHLLLQKGIQVQDFLTVNNKENIPLRVISERKRNRLSSEEDTPPKLLKDRPLYEPSSEDVSPSSQPKRSTREPHEKVVQARYSFSEPKIIETIICENYTGSTDSSISSDVIENTPPNMLNNVTSRKRCEKDSHITNSDNQEDMRIQNNLLVPDAGQESENFGILTEKPNNDCSNKYDRITSPPTLINIIKQHLLLQKGIKVQDFLTVNNKENIPLRVISERKRNRLSSEEDTPPKLLKDRPLYEPSSEDVSPSSPSVIEGFDAVQPSTSSPAPSIVNLEEDLYLSSDDSVADPNWKHTKETRKHASEDSTTTSSENESVSKKKRKIKTVRWHKRQEEKYHRNLQRALRANCLPYKDYKKRLQPPKAPKPIDCKCRFNCISKVKPEDRIRICKSYWGLRDFKRQKDFILSNVQAHAPERRLVAAKRPRTASRVYYLKNEETKVRVCEKFFKATLCISNGPINKAFSGLGNSGVYEKEDLRGKTTPINKTSQDDEDYVKKHIESFPTMESHYCRKTSSKLYLESNLSIPKMYELYKEKCNKDAKDPVSINVYRRIFATQYNLDFYKPKKDQCLLCNKYHTAQAENSSDLELWKAKYDMHIKLKDQSRKAKEDDKARADSDKSFNSITLDLQKVLHMPNSNVSLLYYLRKVNVYNATIYEARSPNDGYCYLWNEMNGKKGSDEIGTVLYFWIKHLPEIVKEISIFTDTCGGQNRNQYLMCLLLYLVQTTNLEVIEQKYLESGHTHMEVDSIHSAIENQLKYIPVFSMNDYSNIIRLARSNRNVKKGAEKKNLYEPVLLTFSDMLDLKDLKNKLNMKNRLVTSDGQKLEWLNVKCFRYEKQRPDVVMFRYDFESDYKELKVTEEKPQKPKSLRKRSKAPIEEEFSYTQYDLKRAYRSTLFNQSKKEGFSKNVH